MAAKKKAAKAGAGAVAAGKAVRSNDYVQRLVEDDELRDNLRTAFESAKNAFNRIEGKGPVKALVDDKKTQKELKEAASSLREAADALRHGKKKKRRGFGKLLLVGLVGGGLALALSEDLRKKVLDALFGAEEEFEYTASTTPNSSSSTSSSSSEPVGTT
jgi:adenylosuccinate synthase